MPPRTGTKPGVPGAAPGAGVLGATFPPRKGMNPGVDGLVPGVTDWNLGVAPSMLEGVISRTDIDKAAESGGLLIDGEVMEKPV